MSTSVATSFAAGVQAERSRVAGQSRVLLTGFDRPAGRALAEALAASGVRLVLQASQSSDAVAVAAGRLAGQAVSVSLVAEPLDDRAGALAVTRGAIAALGGVDALVVVLEPSAADLESVEAVRETDAFLARLLSRPLDLVRAAANRMDVTWTKGTVVIAFAAPERLKGRAALVAQLVRAGLAHLVRQEAERLAPSQIRVVGLVLADEQDASPCAPVATDLVTALMRPESPMPSGLVYEATRAV